MRPQNREILDWLGSGIDERPIRLALMHTNPRRVDGHAVCSHYVETMWLPILGPAALLMARRLVTWAEDGKDWFTLPDLAHHLGLPRKAGRHAPVTRTVARLVRFGFAAPTPDWAGLAVRPIVRAPGGPLLNDLPPALRPQAVAS